MQPQAHPREHQAAAQVPQAGLVPGAAAGALVLPAEWLEETLARARLVLHRDDLFMQALERQHEPLA